METKRFILLVALGLVLTMLWQAWQQDYGQSLTEADDDPLADNNQIKDEPKTEDIPTTPIDHKNNIITGFSDVEKATREEALIDVKTDLLNIQINTLGASIQHLELLDYPVSKQKPNEPIVLLYKRADDFYLAQGGLLSKQEPIDHKTVYQTTKTQYRLGDADQLQVPFVYESDSGLIVRKIWTFHRGSYLVDVDYQVVNNTATDWTGSAYGQFNRTATGERESLFIHTYTGAVISSPEKRYEKVDFGDIENERLAVDVTDGWVAMLQHYFLVALIPSKQETYHYYTLNPEKKSYVIGGVSPAKTIVSGDETHFSQRIYFGPKLQNDLEKIAQGLELSVDYGIFWFLAKPLYWVLDQVHSITNNWGWAIVLVVFLLKLLFFKLSAAGYRSMANMRRVQPRLLAIRDRHKSDRARLNKAMMELYKEEKINPLGGCFPILIQIPVFISFYWVLLESVELRQADFILWIHDLSIPDPYFVLPLLMGASMFIQQKLNPAPLEPIQEKVMSVLPVVFTVFFAFFPAGLVLYWVVNNTLSIAQQWVITRRIEQASVST